MDPPHSKKCHSYLLLLHAGHYSDISRQFLYFIFCYNICHHLRSENTIGLKNLISHHKSKLFNTVCKWMVVNPSPNICLTFRFLSLSLDSVFIIPFPPSILITLFLHSWRSPCCLHLLPLASKQKLTTKKNKKEQQQKKPLFLFSELTCLEID